MENKDQKINNLLSNIHFFLSEFVESEGGGSWAKVDGRDYNTLRDIIGGLIDLKWESDYSGCSSVEFHLCDRNRERMPSFDNLPYENRLRECLHNLSVAMTDADTAMRIGGSHATNTAIDKETDTQRIDTLQRALNNVPNGKTIKIHKKPSGRLQIHNEKDEVLFEGASLRIAIDKDGKGLRDTTHEK